MIDFSALGPVVLQSPSGDRVVVGGYGAHVLSWTPVGHGEQLFLSARSRLDGSAPVRGGVPVIFPQFADYGALPKHGFARTAVWRVARESDARAMFHLDDTAGTRALWPHAFACRLDVHVVEGRLEIGLEVENRDTAPFDFQAALHTYHRVADIAGARIDGLSGTRFRDRTNDDAEAVEPTGAMRIDREVDRLHPDAPHRVVVREPGREVVVDFEGFTDVVAWNPWIDKAAAMNDLVPDEYREFLCVEPAVVAVPVRLAPGATWRGRQILTVRR